MEDRIHKVNQSFKDGGTTFKLADIKEILSRYRWHIRRRLRACRWKQWKKPKTKIET